ncbi:MAG: hypothetical protein IAF94_17650 [Pirellulaceae bacterium]|nr:hypothetical protein [Pirellulaceae bacterium]
MSVAAGTFLWSNVTTSTTVNVGTAAFLDPVCTVRVADTLAGPWDESGNQLQQFGHPVPTGDGVTERVTIRLIAPVQNASRKFLQLKVTVP